ncbi:TonB-dependent receptor [Mucilaginibacter sp. PAMB04168]|uniref:TonB-dependent receptor n=1 Tax=Mucilaginibacter sp. PAMB04168 TaxID=3138567 RepID=UPI0031F6C740
MPISMKYLFVCVLCCCCGVLYGQSVTGHIVDGHQQPVAFANVSLLSPQDSAVRSTLTDGNGTYHFGKVSPGRYKVAISIIGFKQAASSLFNMISTDVILPDIQLVADSKQLSDVIVTGRKPFLEQRADKLIVNVQSSVLAAGATAAEVLRRVPGMRVLNDRVTMTGKNKLIIMVDGRLSQYQDMNVLLRAIPASNIDRIEVISNPSAKFDAEGDTIINIVLKRRQIAGTNGTIGFAMGADPYTLNEVKQGNQLYQRYNPSVSANHRSGKFNVFGSYNYIYRTQFEVNIINRYNNNNYYDQRNYNPSNYGIHTYQAGADFKADSLNTIGIVVNAFNRKGNGDFQNVSLQTNTTNGSLTDAFNSQNLQNNINNNQALNINWRHTFAKAGQSLTVDADAAHYLLDNTSDIYVYPITGKIIHNYQRIKNPINFETIKADYLQPLGKNSKFESGFKTSLAKIDNNLLFEQNNLIDAGRSNRFLYRENINAAYGNFYTTLGKWDFQAGLRAEQTVANGTSSGQKVLNRNYVQAFPSLLLTRRLDSVLAITGQYSRRIGRPSYQQQNPFEVYLDPLTYTKGNPLIKPQTTNSAKLSLTYTGLPVLALSYDQTSDVIVDYAPQQKTVVDANGVPRLVSFSVADNLAKAQNFTAQLNFPIKAGKVVDGYGGLITTLQRYAALYQGSTFEAEKWSYVFFAQADVKISATWAAQFSAYYATSSQYEFIKAGRNSSVDLGIAKKFLNNHGKISLSVSDLFFGDRTLGNINYEDIDLHLKQYNDTRNIILAFVYSFGSQHLKAAGTRTSGADEETKRVKTNL